MNRKQFPDMYGKTQKTSRRKKKTASPSTKEFVKGFKRALGQTSKRRKKKKK